MGGDLEPRPVDLGRALRLGGLAIGLVLSLAAWSMRPGPATVTPRLSPASAGERALLVPASGALFGAWVDPNGTWTGNADAEAEVSDFESQIGRRLDIDTHYYAWTDTFPSGLEQWDLSNGRIPLISWKGTTLSGILRGSSDAMIRTRADAVAALRQPVFLRWAWEMNGNWYPWSGSQNGGARGGPAKCV